MSSGVYWIYVGSPLGPTTGTVPSHFSFSGNKATQHHHHGPAGFSRTGRPAKRRAGVYNPYRVPCAESLNTTAGICPLCSLAFNLRYLRNVPGGYHAPTTFLSLVMNETVHLVFQQEELRRTSTPFRETDPVSPKPCAL